MAGRSSRGPEQESGWLLAVGGFLCSHLAAGDVASPRSSPQGTGLVHGPWLFLADVRWLPGGTRRKPDDAEEHG